MAQMVNVNFKMDADVKKMESACAKPVSCCTSAYRTRGIALLFYALVKVLWKGIPPYFLFQQFVRKKTNVRFYKSTLFTRKQGTALSYRTLFPTTFCILLSIFLANRLQHPRIRCIFRSFSPSNLAALYPRCCVSSCLAAGDALIAVYRLRTHSFDL